MVPEKFAFPASWSSAPGFRWGRTFASCVTMGCFSRFNKGRESPRITERQPQSAALGKNGNVIVVTQDLTKRYADVVALDHCTLGVEQGEVFGLLGPNGAGKTTLIRLLLGFLRPTSGSATIATFDCLTQSVAVRERVAYLPAEAKLFDHMRGREALEFFASVRANGDLAKSLALAKRLELDLRRQVGYMSTGMKQKLALAAVLAAPTPVIILDEPTANLDPSVRSEVMNLVVEASHEGKTILFSSHVMSEVEQACDRVVILRSGRVVHTQSLDSLRSQHRILAKLAGPLQPLPAQLSQGALLKCETDGTMILETPGDLGPLLGWLAQQPLTDVRIEPLGLQSVYSRFHAPDESEAKALPLAGQKLSASTGGAAS
jgi:ABC-2 type transport system ATP-binding protein